MCQIILNNNVFASRYFTSFVFSDIDKIRDIINFRKEAFINTRSFSLADDGANGYGSLKTGTTTASKRMISQTYIVEKFQRYRASGYLQRSIPYRCIVASIGIVTR
ncbi:hypothetical protein EDC94DRAFT_587941 [Helicostylum pulchrum]|nr:hypothetical protein EDC94DRAFT_587941 [Helicostylum pulchrum]